MQQQVIEFLGAIRGGEALQELYEAIQLATEAEQRQQKAAEVTLKISIAPAAQGDKLPVFIGATVSTKLPAVDHGKTIFYYTADDAVLSRRDPRQQDMWNLKTVGGKTPEATSEAAVND